MTLANIPFSMIAWIQTDFAEGFRNRLQWFLFIVYKIIVDLSFPDLQFFSI